MAAQAASLQAEVDALARLAPELAPSWLPPAVDRDLLRMAEREGERGCQALLEVLAAAGEDADECGVCGEPGEFLVDPDAGGNESAILRAVLSFTADAAQLSLRPVKCQFACGLCRQLRQTASLLHELAAERGGEEGIGEALLEHLALVNGRVDIVDRPGLLGAWGQELAARAYALQIACSGRTGWSLRNPDGSPFQSGTPGAAAGLALLLLLPEASPAERRAMLAAGLQDPSEEPQPAAAAPAGTAGKAAAAEAGKKRKRPAAAAAVAEAGNAAAAEAGTAAEAGEVAAAKAGKKRKQQQRRLQEAAAGGSGGIAGGGERRAGSRPARTAPKKRKAAKR